MKKNILITFNENYLNEIDNILDYLREEGMIINNVYDFGVVSGILEEDKFEKIRSFKEILLLKEDEKINIPPPDEDIQ